MKFATITLAQLDNGSYEVTAEGYTTGSLCVDEALGCIASALFGNPEKVPRYMNTNLHEALHLRRYGCDLSEKMRAVLIAAGEPLEDPTRIHRPGFLAYEGTEPREQVAP